MHQLPTLFWHLRLHQDLKVKALLSKWRHIWWKTQCDLLRTQTQSLKLNFELESQDLRFTFEFKVITWSHCCLCIFTMCEIRWYWRIYWPERFIALSLLLQVQTLRLPSLFQHKHILFLQFLSLWLINAVQLQSQLSVHNVQQQHVVFVTFCGVTHVSHFISPAKRTFIHSTDPFYLSAEPFSSSET